MTHLRSLFVQDSDYFNHVEGLRAFAGLGVIWYHFVFFLQYYFPADQYFSLLKNRFLGFGIANSTCLDIFFLVSGFVIGYSLMREYQRDGKINFFAYIVKRIARLYPCYIVLMIVAIPYSFITLHSVWANFLQVNNYLPLSQQYLPWTWSLAVEFQFYVLFAIVLYAIKNWDQKIWLLYACLIMGLMPIIGTAYLCIKNQTNSLTQFSFLISHHQHHWLVGYVYTQLFARMGPIVQGILLGYLTVFHRERVIGFLQSFSTTSTNIFALLLMLIPVMLIAYDPLWSVINHREDWHTTIVWYIASRNIFTLSIAILMLMSLSPSRVVSLFVNFFGSKLWRPLGQLAFCSFLFHPIFISLCLSWHFNLHSTLTSVDIASLAAQTLFMSYFTAGVLYCWVEMPIVQITKRMLYQGRKGFATEANYRLS